MGAFTAEEQRLAEPQPIEDSTLQAWYMDNSDEDQRLPHKKKPNEPCSLASLRALGVLSWRMDAPDAWEGDAKLAAIRKVRGYSYTEIVNIRRDTLPDYDAKIKMFYQEHIHADEEIRYVLDGRGYFDVRDKDDRWIRIACEKGDLIVLPEGIYHRFTLDTGDYVKAMRLFVGEPVWTPINRGPEADAHEARRAYERAFLAAAAKGQQQETMAA